MKDNQEVLFEFINPIKTKELNNIKDNLEETNFLKIIQGKENQIGFLQKEILYSKIEKQLQDPSIKEKIIKLQKEFEDEVCSTIPNAFWGRKVHTVSLPYEKDFDESKIPTKERPIQMNSETLEFCKKEIK